MTGSTHTVPPPAEQVASAHKQLLDGGWRDIGHIRRLRVGVRVRLATERYDHALRRGTGVVVALTEKRPSAWAKDWGRRDVELVVLRDLDRRTPDYKFGAVARVADYHVAIVDNCYWCNDPVDPHGGCTCKPRGAAESGQAES